MISVISQQQLIYSCISCVSPGLGWALKCLAQGHSHENPRICLKDYTCPERLNESYFLLIEEKVLCFTSTQSLQYYFQATGCFPT